MSASILQRAIRLLDLGLSPADERSGFRSEHIESDGDDGVFHIHSEPGEAETIPLVRAEPRDMDEALVVADEIKRRIPVILNLEEADPEQARRICDFLGGVTYGMSGDMQQLGSRVYACAPFDMPIETLAVDGALVGEARYEARDEYDQQEQVY